MARRDDLLGVSAAETIIGADVAVKGNLSGGGDIMLDCKLSGEITTSGDVTIGVNAIIKANLRGQNVHVAGQLAGDIEASGEVTISETGQVKGDITSTSLAIASGATFIGKSIMTQPQARELDAPDAALDT